MKVFVAGIFTETNTFAPVPTGMSAFEQMGVRRGNGSGSCGAFGPAVDLLRVLADEEGDELLAGLLAIAQPGGRVKQAVHEALRDELLAGLRSHGRVDAVVLLLHGAMVAERCFDCEGELIESVRSVVGPHVPIGVELDLHCHLTSRMIRHADVLIAYKLYPHTDVLDRLREVWRMTRRTALGQLRPRVAVVDCHANGLWPTSREPMASFVRSLQHVETLPGVLSASLAHGFPWGDVPAAGAKVWVLTDDDEALAHRLAKSLAREFEALGGDACFHATALDAALDRVRDAIPGRPIVLADIADNPGGGASGDSTFILQALIEQRIGQVALGAVCDTLAVQTCVDAGVGATIALRIGGKAGVASGMPIDTVATICALAPEHHQRGLAGAAQACGASAWIRVGDALDIVLISRRQQVLGLDLFTGLGIDLATKRAIVVKSQLHFLAAFEPIASEVIHVDTPGLLRHDFENLPYRHRAGAVPAVRWVTGASDAQFLP